MEPSPSSPSSQRDSSQHSGSILSTGDSASPEASFGADLALCQGVLNQDPRALGVFAKRLGCLPQILRALDRRTGSRCDASDLSDLQQETLLVVWTKLADFDGSRPLHAWVYRIAYYKLLNLLRSRARTTVSIDENFDQVEQQHAATETPSDQAQLVHEGLATLPEDEHQAVCMKHVDGRTFRDIGEHLGLSASTVKSRYYRGLQQLRAFLEQRGQA